MSLRLVSARHRRGFKILVLVLSFLIQASIPSPSPLCSAFATSCFLHDYVHCGFCWNWLATLPYHSRGTCSTKDHIVDPPKSEKEEPKNRQNSSTDKTRNKAITASTAWCWLLIFPSSSSIVITSSIVEQEWHSWSLSASPEIGWRHCITNC